MKSEMNEMHLNMSSAKWRPSYRASMSQNAPIYSLYKKYLYVRRHVPFYDFYGYHDIRFTALMIVSRLPYIVILIHDLLHAHYEYAIMNCCIFTE